MVPLVVIAGLAGGLSYVLRKRRMEQALTSLMAVQQESAWDEIGAGPGGVGSIAGQNSVLGQLSRQPSVAPSPRGSRPGAV